MYYQNRPMYGNVMPMYGGAYGPQPVYGQSDIYNQPYFSAPGMQPQPTSAGNLYDMSEPDPTQQHLLNRLSALDSRDPKSSWDLIGAPSQPVRDTRLSNTRPGMRGHDGLNYSPNDNLDYVRTSIPSHHFNSSTGPARTQPGNVMPTGGGGFTPQPGRTSPPTQQPTVPSQPPPTGNRPTGPARGMFDITPQPPQTQQPYMGGYAPFNPPQPVGANNFMGQFNSFLHRGPFSMYSPYGFPEGGSYMQGTNDYFAQMIGSLFPQLQNRWLGSGFQPFGNFAPGGGFTPQPGRNPVPTGNRPTGGRTTPSQPVNSSTGGRAPINSSTRQTPVRNSSGGGRRMTPWGYR